MYALPKHFQETEDTLRSTTGLNWWQHAMELTQTPSEASGHPCGENEMLTIICYDIADPRRLHNIAKICEDYGVRVQYSIFECRLHANRFELFWKVLLDEIDPNEDRLVAYKVCARCAREIQSAGATMITNPQYVAYVY